MASEELTGQVAAANFASFSITTSANHVNTGWVAGGGLEFMATANWLLRIEYLHYAFNSGTTIIAAVYATAVLDRSQVPETSPGAMRASMSSAAA